MDEEYEARINTLFEIWITSKKLEKEMKDDNKK
jgi:hypothetical protein